jgi:hypothetical protein
MLDCMHRVAHFGFNWRRKFRNCIMGFLRLVREAYLLIYFILCTFLEETSRSSASIAILRPVWPTSKVKNTVVRPAILLLLRSFPTTYTLFQISRIFSLLSAKIMSNEFS